MLTELIGTWELVVGIIYHFLIFYMIFRMFRIQKKINTSIFSGLISGPLSNILGARQVAMLGLGISSAGLAIAAFSTGFYMLMVTFSLMKGIYKTTPNYILQVFVCRP